MAEWRSSCSPGLSLRMKAAIFSSMAYRSGFTTIST
jgi:hypothetical protein